MRKSHYVLFAVAAATAGYLTAAPGHAAVQDEDSAMTVQAEPELSPEQKAEHDSWPEAEKAAYAAWPVETKTYYWSLPFERQRMFWRLTDEDKIAMTAMTGPEREAAWSEIEATAAMAPPEG